MESPLWSDIFPRRLKARFSLDITPLVDIVFLLVAFFMLSSSLGKESTIHVDLPQAEQNQASSGQNMVISITKDGEVYFNNQKIKDSDYKQGLSDLFQGKDSVKESRIIIRGDKQSPYEIVVGVMDTLSGLGIHDFALAISKQ